MTSPTSATTSARGFTLVELLCVIGIIAVLVSIALPVLNRANRAAQRTRVAAHLHTISVALDSYYNDHKTYPKFGTARGQTGSDLLVRALIAPFDAAVDGADGDGFRLRMAQGTKYGPYIPPGRVEIKWKPGTPTDPCEILDGAGGTILYYPASSSRPNITAGSGYIGTHPASMYDTSYGNGYLQTDAFQFMMGDDSGTPNGRIDNGERAKTTAPYVLWAPGPDGVYGPRNLTRNDAARCDDVTNF